MEIDATSKTWTFRIKHMVKYLSSRYKSMPPVPSKGEHASISAGIVVGMIMAVFVLLLVVTSIILAIVFKH